MARHFTYAIIGGGIAGVTCAEHVSNYILISVDIQSTGMLMMHENWIRELQLENYQQFFL